MLEPTVFSGEQLQYLIIAVKQKLYWGLELVVCFDIQYFEKIFERNGEPCFKTIPQQYFLRKALHSCMIDSQQCHGDTLCYTCILTSYFEIVLHFIAVIATMKGRREGTMKHV